MANARGFTLIETLIGLLILMLVVTTSLAVFFERQRRLKEADDMIVAYQAIANEAEIERQVNFGELSVGPIHRFHEIGILSSLKNPVTSVRVRERATGERIVTMNVSWDQTRHHAELSIIRVGIPRGSFW